MTLDEFEVLLETTGMPVSHWSSDKQLDYPYIAYFEYAEGDLTAENRQVASFDYVQVSYFTTDKKDLNVKRIKDLLNDNEIAFSKKTSYEDGTNVFIEDEDEGTCTLIDKVVHHIFDCELL